jgi:sigma-B regulation protein RsbU (phosphoserine phosphatase)
VGGDYFQYFSQEGKLILSLADVTGHAMEAAIPVVMFSGILKSHMELGGALQERFERLNRSIYGAIRGRTLVCLAMGELDLSTHTLSLSDSGCPYPYHFRASAGDVVELQVDAYPLGVRPDTEYPVIQARLGAGDRVVFCSDGIAEAVNAAGEQFGYDRTAEVIRRACAEGLPAEATIGRILDSVNAFRGDAPQADDMTCVVMRVERERREKDEKREAAPRLTPG